MVEVCAQGLPNLLHEFVHVVLAARLDHDHGIDYQQIPFELQTLRGRTVMWEEMCCCTLSCAYLCREGAPTPAVDAWFAEQLEIQPVFYGFEDRPAAFVEALVAAVNEHGEELDAMEARAYRLCDGVLTWAGAPSRLARPPLRLTARDLMRRQGWAV